MRIRSLLALVLAVLVLTTACTAAAGGLSSLPGHDRFEQVTRTARSISAEGRVDRIHWSEDGGHVFYVHRGDLYRFDLATHELHELTDDEQEQADRGASRSRWLRGRQRDEERSPCGTWLAKCIDWNVIIQQAEGDDAIDDAIIVTTDGTRKHRYGKASWVYGEELRQNDAMWWSPDSNMLAFYELDERAVPDYYLTSGLTEFRSELMVEGYPKPGEPNPIARLWVYHIDTGERIAVHVGDDQEQYIYNVRFSPDGSLLLFNRTNRRQNVLDVVAADPHSGETRIVLTETQETWQTNSPEMRFLDDGERFIWATESSGWKHYQLRHLDGRLLSTLTRGRFECAAIMRVDEDRQCMFYTAYSDEDPLNLQLHRVALDGTDDVRLTDAGLNHSVDVSPCGNWFIARSEALATPPVTRLHDRDGNEIATLAEADLDRIAALNWPQPELFTFKADDGVTDLYGTIHKPTNFDPARVYPMLLSVYGGPLSQRVRNAYRPAEPTCEFGFIIVTVDNRGTANRGKAFADAAYLKLGIVDIKDQADAVRLLTKRPYIDGDRVGIYGGSYGGYLAALGLMRYPDVFHAAVATAAVTDWRNYDTIYTERFMRLPEENMDNYVAGSVLTYVDQLQGHLLIQHGMVDDNVHPANAFQLIDALHEAGKDFELMMYPNRAHGLGVHARDMRLRFFVKHLIDAPSSGPAQRLVRDSVDDDDEAAEAQ